MLALGVVLGAVGIDPVFGEARFTFGIARLMDGFDFVVAGMGLFGIAEVLIGAEARRQTGLGFFIGALPGGGAAISSFLAYAVEKRIAREPERFGRGAIEGVASPEAANNAASTSSFIPLLTLGIPGNSAIAMIFVAFMIHGVQPGPLLVVEHPSLFWGLIASMYVGNVALLVLNLPLIWVWVRLLRVPYQYLAVLVVITCAAGAYSIRNSAFDVAVVTAFGALGFLLRKGGFPAAALVLAMILGRMLERSFLQSLQMLAGDLTIFLERPISAGLLAVTAVLLLAPAARRLWPGAVPVETTEGDARIPGPGSSNWMMGSTAPYQLPIQSRVVNRPARSSPQQTRASSAPKNQRRPIG
jgi:putative tricarboxylic transport membrane protein